MRGREEQWGPLQGEAGAVREEEVEVEVDVLCSGVETMLSLLVVVVAVMPAYCALLASAMVGLAVKVATSRINTGCSTRRTLTRASEVVS
jgi:hypothetical protein